LPLPLLVEGGATLLVVEAAADTAALGSLALEFFALDYAPAFNSFYARGTLAVEAPMASFVDSSADYETVRELACEQVLVNGRSLCCPQAQSTTFIVGAPGAERVSLLFARVGARACRSGVVFPLSPDARPSPALNAHQ
jgi:hypothetical protein